MAYNFNADEILRLAEEIERNGALFYTLAAEQTKTPSTRQFFTELASMEKEHVKVFTSLRSKLTAQEQASVTFDPDGETAQYLKALAGVSVIDEKAKKAFDIDIFRGWCKSCGICAAFCPRECIETDENGSPVVTDANRCSGCGWCELHCPDFAVSVRPRPVKAAAGEGE